MIVDLTQSVAILALSIAVILAVTEQRRLRRQVARLQTLTLALTLVNRDRLADCGVHVHTQEAP